MKKKETIGGLLFKADIVIAIIMAVLLVVGVFLGTFDTMAESTLIIKIVPFVKCVAIGVFIMSIVVQFMSIGFKISYLEKKSALNEIVLVTSTIFIFTISMVFLHNQVLATATAITLIIANLVTFQGLRMRR